MAKKPEIYCRKGKPLGEFQVQCDIAFQAAADLSATNHGPKAARVYEAADHLIRGLHHLTVTHGLDLVAAHKVASGAVGVQHGLSAVVLREVVGVACTHWTRGTELNNVLLGSAP